MTDETVCPGCGLRMPRRQGAVNTSYYNTSAECWSVYTEVLGAEYGNVVLFGQVHQLTVDAYAVQHAGGPHPDKSLDLHLCGLYLVLEGGHRSPEVPALLQRIASAVTEWPRWPPPEDRGALTVCDVALADSAEAHADLVRDWASSVWRAWAGHHTAVADFLAQHLAPR
jgi:Family of unknown function (DUF5946)